MVPVHSLRAGHCTCPACADCLRPGKHPRTTRSWQDATRDVATIAAWWRRWPATNVAVATGPSGLAVLDVDPRHDGDASLADLAHQHGPLPVTPTAHTGGGGWHHYFAAPPGQVIRSRAGVQPGLDVRAAGGYVVPRQASTLLAAGTRGLQGARRGGGAGAARGYGAQAWLVNRTPVQ